MPLHRTVWQVALKSDYFEAYNNRGTAKFNKGDYNGAINDFW